MAMLASADRRSQLDLDVVRVAERQHVDAKASQGRDISMQDARDRRTPKAADPHGKDRSNSSSAAAILGDP